MKIRYYIDSETDKPHIYIHKVEMSIDQITDRGKEVKNSVKTAIFGGKEASNIRLDFSSFDNMFQSYVYCTIGRCRNAEIFLGRVGIEGKSIPTYDKLGKQYGLSRQRIDQIIQIVLPIIKKPANLQKLTPFWSVVTEIVKGSGGLVDIQYLFNELNARFEWSDKNKEEIVEFEYQKGNKFSRYANGLIRKAISNAIPDWVSTIPPKIWALANLLSFDPTFQVDKNYKQVLINDSPCISCSEVSDKLRFLFKPGIEEMHIMDAGYRLAQLCRVSCSINSDVIDAFSPAFIVSVAQALDDLLIEDEKLLTRERWQLRYGETLKDVIYATLKELRRPMHYIELAEHIRLNNMKYGNIINHSVLACLCNYEDFKLAGRGIYGLVSWDLKPYKSHAKAIIELLEKQGEPMKKATIISTLTQNGEYKVPNLQSAFTSHPRILKVGDNIYDLRERVDKSKDLERFRGQTKTID